MEIKPLKVLLIEDNEGDVFLTIEIFEENHITVDFTIARNGAEAIEILKGQHIGDENEDFDVIFLDINLPIYNGHEVLKHIHGTPRLNKIPIFVLTTSSHPQDKLLVESTQCVGYLAKPLNFEQFVEAARNIEPLHSNLLR